MTEIISQDYKKLLTEIKERIRTAQYAALKAVNSELISLFGTSARILLRNKKVKLGANLLLKNYPKTCGKSFLK